MQSITCDVCVIGAGAAGLSVAAGASQMGANVVLLEAGEMGGDCLNYGCVPSKALISAANQAQRMRTGAPLGVASAEPHVDYPVAMAHVRHAIETIAPVDSQERFEGLGVRVIREFGRFAGPDELVAGDFSIRARRFVIATGSKPRVPDVPGLNAVPFLTNETLWDLKERPAHLIVMGGGPIGLEMAQAHARLGSQVTVVEAAQALGREDREAADLVLARLRDEGVAVLEHSTVARVEHREGRVAVNTGDDVIEGSHLLVAVGRDVNVSDLEPDKAGIAVSNRGVTVNTSLRSSNRRVYAIGDAAGGPQFTHLAGYHAGVVIRSILFGLPSKARSDHIPRVTFTSPELAQVGLTEDEARNEFGGRLEVARFPYDENDRAVADNETSGFAKVMVVRGRPVGATIVGAHAGDLISVWALALSAKLKMSAIAGMVAPYPTLGEISKRAAGAYFSPRLFDNAMVKRVVSGVQRFVP